MRQQEGPAAHPRGGEGGFRTGVATSDHDDVESLWELHRKAAHFTRAFHVEPALAKSPLVPRETSDVVLRCSKS
jgi:hypothetical protein